LDNIDLPKDTVAIITVGTSVAGLLALAVAIYLYTNVGAASTAAASTAAAPNLAMVAYSDPAIAKHSVQLVPVSSL
jgi:chromosome segregation and condensation protein ScpB